MIYSMVLNRLFVKFEIKALNFRIHKQPRLIVAGLKIEKVNHEFP